MPEDEFRAAAREFTGQDQWIIDGNYTAAGVLDIVWERSVSVVWLDLPKRTVMRQVASRTVTRAVTGEGLWNGNRERWSSLLKWAPEENILRWTWTRFDHIREKYEDRMTEPKWRHLNFSDCGRTARWRSSLHQSSCHLPESRGAATTMWLARGGTAPCASTEE